MQQDSDLRTAIIDAHERFTRAVEGLDHAVLESEAAVGVWSPRDVAAHLTDWVEEILAAAACCLGGPQPAHHPIADGEAYNQRQAELHQDESWEAVTSRLDLVITDALAFVSRLEPGQEALETYYPWGGGGTLARLLSGIVFHHDEHAAELEGWRERRREVG
jgi:hypothetical protein